MVLLPLVDGQVKPLRGTTRARLIDVLARQVSTFDQAVKSLSALLNERLDEALKDTGSTAQLMKYVAWVSSTGTTPESIRAS